MGRLDGIQTALKPLRNRKKLKYISMTILGRAESFNNDVPARPNPTATLFESYFLESIEYS